MAIYCAKCGATHECSVCPACHGSGHRDETKCVHVTSRDAEVEALEREAEEQSRLIEKQAAEIATLRQRIESAPVAIMDTRDALGICAPTEEDFPALYALQGKRVRLIVEDGE